MHDRRVHKHPLGFWQVSNIPSKEKLKTYYTEKYFQSGQGNYREAYSDAELDFFEAKIHQKFLQARELGYCGQAGRLLDVGCGEGFTLSYFRRAGWEIEGLDYSAAGVTTMHPACIDALVVGDVISLLEERIQFRHSYDVIWLSNVLEHVPDPVGLLEQLKQLLAVNGLLVVCVPNDFSTLQRYLLDKEKVDTPYWIALPDHLAYFDKDSLRKIALHTGYSMQAILADFPIDWFLIHSQGNFVRDRSRGRDAHLARLELEALISLQPGPAVNDFYRAMANIGMGRNITAFMTPGNK